MCPMQSSRAGADRALFGPLSPANNAPNRRCPQFPIVQLPKMGSEKMSFAVTTTININTSAMPVR